MVRLLVSTGEVSGDLQGSLLIRALHAEAQSRGIDLQVQALGGERMRQAGAELIADTAAMGAIGLWEALPLVLPTLRLQRRLARSLELSPPDAVVLIDYMGANVNLGLRIKRQSPQVPVVYYIAPQEWAFRLGEGGTTRLIGFSDLILAIFPEEARFYSSRGARVIWVGHPLLDTLAEQPTRQQARSALGLEGDAPVLLLMPASRRQELRYLLPPMLAAVAELQRRVTGLRVLVPAGLRGFEPQLQQLCQAAGVEATVIPADQADRLKPQLCAAADAALTKSGTVNLELALRNVPQVVGYRVSRITAFVAKHLLRFSVPHISPVNLVVEQRLVPELLQDELTPEAMVAALEPLLKLGSPERDRLLAGYDALRRCLGEPGVTRRAAAAVLEQCTALCR